MPGDLKLYFVRLKLRSGFSGVTFALVCFVNLFSAQYSLAFRNHGGTSSYVIIRDLAFSLKAFTLCLWMKTDDREHSGTPFSYSTTSEKNELLLYDYKNFVLYVHGITR